MSHNPFDIIVTEYMGHVYYLRPTEFNSDNYNVETLKLPDGSLLQPIKAVSQCHRCGNPIELQLLISTVPKCGICDKPQAPAKISTVPFTSSIPTKVIEDLLIVEPSSYVTYDNSDSIGSYVRHVSNAPNVVVKKPIKPSLGPIQSLNSNVVLDEVIPQLGDEGIHL